MAMKLKQIFNKFELIQNIMAYVKDAGSNLQTCVIVLNLIMSCTNLNMVKPFDDFYYGHALLKYVNMSFQVRRCFTNYIMHQ
jgi:hypothetical protein